MNENHILIILSVRVPRKCAPYMGALAAAGCAWAARGDPGYTPHSLVQRALRIQWGLSQRACLSTGAFLNGRCASTAGFRTLQVTPRAIVACSSLKMKDHWYQILAYSVVRRVVHFITFKTKATLLHEVKL